MCCVLRVMFTLTTTSFFFFLCPVSLAMGRRGFRRGTRDGRQVEEGESRKKVRGRAGSFPQVPHREGGGVRGAGEDMGGGMGGPSARGAEGVRGSADPLQETVEGRAVAGAELGEDGTVAAGEEFLLLGHHGRGGKEDFVMGSGGDRPGDRLRVKGFDGGFI